MEIKTRHLVLRPLAEGDLHTTHAYASDPENGMFIEFLPNDTLEDTANFLRWAAGQWLSDTQTAYEFAITLDGAHIGAVSVNLDGDVASLGWIIHKAHWGKGYATEAAIAIRDFALDKLGAAKIVATCDYRNTTSVAIMKKIGMTLECASNVRNYKDGERDVQELRYALHRC